MISCLLSPTNCALSIGKQFTTTAIAQVIKRRVQRVLNGDFYATLETIRRFRDERQTTQSPAPAEQRPEKGGDAVKMLGKVRKRFLAAIIASCTFRECRIIFQ